MPAALIDHFLPIYEIETQHHVDIAAPVEDVYSVVRQLDFSGSRLARVIVWIRNVPARLRGEQALGLTLDDLVDLGFILLADDPPRELVLGFAGEFWTSTGNLKKLEPEAFREFAAPGCAKAAMNFAATPLENGHTRLTTETRAQCFDDASRRKLERYISFTRHLRSVLRWSMLRAFKSGAEAAVRRRSMSR